MQIEPEQRHLLEDLRDAIESGNYPVGIRPQNRQQLLGLDVQGDFQTIFGLFSRIEDNLRQICLDGVLAPMKPSRLGLRAE